MNAAWIAVVAYGSWLVTLAHECRFYVRARVLERKALRALLPTLFATWLLQPALVAALLAGLDRIPFLHARPAVMAAIGLGSVFEARLLRAIATATLRRLGPVGAIIMLVADARIWPDFGPWRMLRTRLERWLAARTADLQVRHGRNAAQLIRRHRRRIVDHLRFQRRYAWLAGGPWYSNVRLRDLSDDARLKHPEVFAVIANAIGVQRLPGRSNGDDRSFTRSRAPRDGAVYVIPPRRRGRRERARLLDVTVHGLRVRAVGTSLTNVPVGRTVLIETPRGRFRCVKRWQRHGEAGLEIVASRPAQPALP